MTLRPPYRVSDGNVVDDDGVVIAQMLVDDREVERAIVSGLNRAAFAGGPPQLPGAPALPRPAAVLTDGRTITYRCTDPECGCEW